MIWQPSWFLLFFQNGRNRAISEGIQKSLLGAINGGKQTADVSKMQAWFYHFWDFKPSQLWLSSLYSLKTVFVYFFIASSAGRWGTTLSSELAGQFYAMVFMVRPSARASLFLNNNFLPGVSKVSFANFSVPNKLS